MTRVLAGVRRRVHEQAGGKVQGHGALQGYQRGIQAVPPPHAGKFHRGLFLEIPALYLIKIAMRRFQKFTNNHFVIALIFLKLSRYNSMNLCSE